MTSGNMFESFKEKLNSAQGNFAASFLGLTRNEGQPQIANQLHSYELNFAAGTDLLEKFQANWAELNAQSLHNARKAEAVDEKIGELHKQVEGKWRNITQCCAVLNKLPEVMSEVEALTRKIGTLDELFATVEKSLIHLNNLMETRELQERQLDHRFQLALYKEKKLSHLENTRVALARDHAEKVTVHDARQLRVKKERQEAFEQQFKQDLSLYKETKNIPKIQARVTDVKELKLEEVELDNDDGEALDDFLHESTPEKQTEELDESQQRDSS